MAVPSLNSTVAIFRVKPVLDCGTTVCVRRFATRGPTENPRSLIMAILFNCPHCGSQTNVDDRFAGQSGPCRSCGKTITVPAAAGGAVPSAADYAPPASKGTSGTAVLVIIACVVGGGLLIVGILAALLVPAVQATRGRAQRTMCVNNLKQIGIAMHNYHDVYGCFPPAYIADANGKPMHSWRVLILPFVEGEHIYNAYNFNEPWDGPNNSLLSQIMPEVYACPDDPQAPGTNKTCYLGISGPGAIFNGDMRCTLRDITDGTENTLMVAEVAGANVNWMEPRDLDAGQMTGTINAPGGKDISSHHPVGASTLYADGSVHFLPAELPSTTIRALSTKSGGELVIVGGF
jgi:type II secretory pathway pseudopilin PulG